MFHQTITCYLSICFVFIGLVSPAHIPKTDWFGDAQRELHRNLRRKKNTNVAKNIVLFVGDGMGVSTVTAARILRGQLNGRTGEETVLEFEKFPHSALSKTYANDKQTPDSGATATAMLCGVKTNILTIGVNDNIRVSNCSTLPGNELSCITDWFKKAGRSSGFVTTTRVTHATPAATYAKTPNRNWENDVLMNLTGIPSEDCGKDIAYQLIFDSSLKVMMGGGRIFFLDKDTNDPEAGNSTQFYQRQDGLNLIKEWKKKYRRGRYVWNKAQFDSVDPEKTNRLLGLFEASHMHYEADRNDGPNGEPSLAQMTAKAIRILRKDPNGFFLLVEGGRIDHGHHANNAGRALREVLAFEDAVKRAVRLTNEKDTLIIVTADHSHPFTMSGYQSRGNDILGVADNILDLNGVPYTTLSYANGPGYRYGDRNYTNVANSAFIDFKQEVTVPLAIDSHAGEDVAIYARGPMSHLIDGVQEQNYIAHVMAHAACVGPHQCHNFGWKKAHIP